MSDGPNPRRLPAHAVAAITALRIAPPGAEVALVNISPTGLLAESPSKLRVGSPVEVQFQGQFIPPSVTGRVVRCEVAVMERDGLLRYHIGIEFDAPLNLADSVPDRPVTPAVAPAVRNRW